ncbi:unnamed protein product [Adineta ricciae]|uniref:Uncharacterized protein n=1 Tax=Adineta ricciae TaxID=249248 RepID=A0A814T4Z1_ADIRI|nr:unnamed protein product [Adineta ricciae]
MFSCPLTPQVNKSDAGSDRIPGNIHKTPRRHPCSTIALLADHQYLALGSDETLSVWATNGEPKTTKSIAVSN